ncbi:stage II sporulation protein R [Lysinibacillus piscis]|uniref:Stage II sporulation protein R n=1 Tax=Lysinibacillus piscis TaxID=2518931 RepID=A0ABQ5NIN6_9BACI|nr:stage II sporulation protein R [Lysinibacillus sp. KH24]GLC87937.1 hypothetical protein LYSBPC_10640 [Lysinibacillus sp. KH24]
MLNEYKITRLSKLNIIIACVKLIVMGIALQLCVYYIPILIDLAKETMNQVQEQDFRVRVIANSNTAHDQYEKQQLVQELQPYFQQVTKDVDKEQLLVIRQQMEQHIKENYPQTAISVILGANLFPPKRHQAILYPQNMYQSIVIQIGDARGDNWWCSVFPNVCEPDKEEEEESEVNFFVWEWLKGVFEEL